MPASAPAAAGGGAAALREIRFGHRRASQEDGGSGAATPYPPNVVTTSKYTWYNFVPKNLWEQLHKAANVYFLLISIVMFSGNITTWTGGTPLFYCIVKFYSTFLALFIMMTASAVMAALDDYRRHQADDKTNQQLAVVVRTGSSGKVSIDSAQWKDVAVGDILVVRGEEEFPADLVPLATSSEEGGCYVSTANLDGETNLKIKAAAACAQHALLSAAGEATLLQQAVSGLGGVRGTLRAEAPQKSIHNFTGSIQLVGGSEEPLRPKNLLLRGTVLRNTAWVVGLVVYTGDQTRMVMNSRRAKPKLANLERVVNASMLVVVGAQCLLAFVSDVLYCITLEEYLGYWYLFPDGEPTQIILPQFVGYWLSFFVLYSNLMPISLYFTMEVCNAAQAYFIKSDLEMYDEEQECPANARSTNLCHELGQVNYIFSDKTGTLTQNVMELKRVSIDGRTYGHVDEGAGFNGSAEILEGRRNPTPHGAQVNAFLEILSVSHTVVATQEGDGRLRYEAESPDEGALVEAVAKLGWSFVGRTGHSITVEKDGSALTYRLLALNAFTSARKRQSVVVEDPAGERLLLVKGADDVMLGRARDPGAFPKDDLAAFAREGLRTLVLGRRPISDAEFGAWRAEYERAQTTMQDREAALASVAESIEQQLDIVGVTAIEDKLQVGVQQTIVRIREAGIKFWVLTGDKLETARNIGFSTRVLSDDMDIMVVDTCGDGEQLPLSERLADLEARSRKALGRGDVAAMIVTGQALEEITRDGGGEGGGGGSKLKKTASSLDSASRRVGKKGEALSPSLRQFLEVAKRCSVVIACRVAPLQKSELVRLVRKGVHPAPVTLAIGDGANDVPMIQQAQVGVGISGREGRQAVNSADFAIAQFRYLQRLLLVHGMWNYHRACKFVLYSFWKNAVLVLLMFYYTLISGYAGTSLFEDMIRASYNFVLAAPIIATGVFDREASAEASLANPALYDMGRLGLALNPVKLVEMLLSAFVHSLIILIVVSLASSSFEHADACDYYTFGTIVFTILIIAMNYRAAFLTRTWNWYSIAAQVFSYALYGVVILLMYCMWKPVADVFQPWMYNVTVHMLRCKLFWVCALAVPALAMVVDAFKAYLVFEFLPDRGQLAKERAEAVAHGSGTARRVTSGASRPGSVQSGSPQLPRTSPVSSFDFSHPGGEPRHQDTFQAHPMAGDTSLLDGLSCGSARTGPPTITLPLGDARGGVGGVSSGDSDASGDEFVSQADSGQPAPSLLAQQRLPSWELHITWLPVFVASAVVGLLLLVMGVGMCSLGGTPHVVIVYAGEPQAWNLFGPRWDSSGAVIESAPRCAVPSPGGTRLCSLTPAISEAIEGPVMLRYAITPFYQNYPQYIASGTTSGAWPELTGQILSPDARSKQCRDQATAVTAQGDLIFPCGRQATSVFNDTFEVFVDGVRMELDQSELAWESDVQMFRNPPGYDRLPGYSWLPDRYPAAVSRRLGAKDELFVSWMRPQALPHVLRRYGRFNSSIPAGANVTIRVSASFPVEHLGAQKHLLLESSHAHHGDGRAFGTFLLGAGAVCWVFAGATLGIRGLCPRAAGKVRFGRDPSQIERLAEDSGGEGSDAEGSSDEGSDSESE